jgi:hypothetical protein
MKFNGFLEILKSLITIYKTWCGDNWVYCTQYENNTPHAILESILHMS